MLIENTSEWVSLSKYVLELSVTSGIVSASLAIINVISANYRYDSVTEYLFRTIICTTFSILSVGLSYLFYTINFLLGHLMLLEKEGLALSILGLIFSLIGIFYLVAAMLEFLYINRDLAKKNIKEKLKTIFKFFLN